MSRNILGSLGIYFRHVLNGYIESKKEEEVKKKKKHLMNKQVAETMRNKDAV